VPDFKISGLGAIPCAVECKRRLGLTEYEIGEAREIEQLYLTIRPELRRRGVHASIEVNFSIPIREIERAQFASDALSCIEWDRDGAPTAFEWGSLAVQWLPYFRTVWRTRLYSPDFLEEVFGWRVLETEWDGIICEVEPPEDILVESFRLPLCLKWRSDSSKALEKKSRGIASLLGSAIKQIPPGELGFVYIAYPELNRPALADSRMRNIMRALEGWWYEWYVRVPVTVINRLYPRPMGVGNPDLIESAVPAAAKGHEHWLTYLPRLVFTRQFDDDDQ
jgi:hypothetical protein